MEAWDLIIYASLLISVPGRDLVDIQALPIDWGAKDTSMHLRFGANFDADSTVNDDVDLMYLHVGTSSAYNMEYDNSWSWNLFVTQKDFKCFIII